MHRAQGSAGDVAHRLREAARDIRAQPLAAQFFAHMHVMLEAADILDAKGIVTATADETQSGSVERSEIEPGPKGSPNG